MGLGVCPCANAPEQFGSSFLMSHVGINVILSCYLSYFVMLASCGMQAGAEFVEIFEDGRYDSYFQRKVSQEEYNMQQMARKIKNLSV